jgi:hypothetical protein
MPRKRQPTQLLPISISQSANPTAETQRQRTRDREPKAAGETFRSGPSKLPSTTTQLHDTLGTLRFDAWSGPFRRAARRPILARLSPCDGRLYGRPAVSPDRSIRIQIRCIWRSCPTSGVQRKCATRITSRSSGCCRRSTLLAFAGCRGARSTERLRAASCAPRGSVTGSASIRPSWSVGSRERRAGRVRRYLGGFGVEPQARRVACASCSMRARKARRSR